MPSDKFKSPEKKENIPEKKGNIPVSLSGINENIDRRLSDITLDLMDGVVIPATVIDLQEPGLFLKEEQLLKWAEKITDLNFINEEKEDPKKLEEKYKKINNAYQNAKVFLIRDLGYNQEEVFIPGYEKLDSKEKLINLLKKTKINNSGNEGLGQSLKYCRLTKATIAAFEATKHDALFLKSLTKHFEDSLFSDEEEERDTPLKLIHNTNGTEFKVQDTDGTVLFGSFSLRSKDFKGVLLRYLTRPESDAETALADGIGVRMIVDTKQALKLCPILYKWLIEKMNMFVVNIENQGYFSEEQVGLLKEGLKEKFKEIKEDKQIGEAEDFFNFTNEKPNSTSSGNFKVLTIKGSLNFSEKDGSIVMRNKKGRIKGDKDLTDVSIHARSVEIQILVPENENEKGANNHDLYDIKKIITARTRLDGWCPEEVFHRFVNEASLKSGMSVKTIEGFLLGKHKENPGNVDKIAQKAPIVKLKKGGKFIYIAFSVYKRWKEIGILRANFLKEIEDERKYLDL